MNLSGAEVLRYALPFRAPVRLASRTVASGIVASGIVASGIVASGTASSGTVEGRAGFLLRLRAGELTGYGEASPVWWLGEESLDVVWHDLSAFAAELNQQRPCVERLRGALADAVSAADDAEQTLALRALRGSRAALCAIETALLDLEARASGRTCAALLGATAVASVECNALLAEPEPAAAAAAAVAFLDAGFRTIKLKVGAQPLARDIERVAAVCGVCAGRGRLRLDANRAWDAATARQALAAVAAWEIDYIEEPLAAPSPAALAQLRRTAPVAIAADESIAGVDDVAQHAAAGACDVVVLKASRIGGPTRVIATAAAAVAAGMRVVCTDSIETAVGRAAAVHIAAALPGPPTAVGLGGSFFLARDVTTDAVVAQPRVDVCGPGLGTVTLRRDME